jgi:hypothetical protein
MQSPIGAIKPFLPHSFFFPFTDQPFGFVGHAFHQLQRFLEVEDFGINCDALSEGSFFLLGHGCEPILGCVLYR